jgi:hypothetical protein
LAEEYCPALYKETAVSKSFKLELYIVDCCAETEKFPKKNRTNKIPESVRIVFVFKSPNVSFYKENNEILLAFVMNNRLPKNKKKCV